MTSGTIAAVVAVLGISAVLATLVRARARIVIRRVQKNLNDQIAKQRKEITSLQREVATLRKQISWLEVRTSLTVAGSPLLPAAPKNAKRSVLFLHNGTYNFAYLSAALRRRGWDAVTVTNLPRHRYDADVHLFSTEPRDYRARMSGLYSLAQHRFRMVHFGGEPDSDFAFFANETQQPATNGTEVRWDLRELRAAGVKIGYTTSGCLDGVRQSAFRKHNGACGKCPWEQRTDLCSDDRNADWGETVSTMCDLVTIEADYCHEWRRQSNVYREPLIAALDPERWRPDLAIPANHRLERRNGELVVFHDFGHPALRKFGRRDIWGTGAIVAAIERLNSEGHSVRLEHSINRPPEDVRFVMAQADVIVDQLILGRYGARAREGLMLGKPTICHIDRTEPQHIPELTCWNDCPLVDATEDTIYSVLAWLLSSPEDRKKIGDASREYAMKWHAPDSAAERFEWVYDRIMADSPVNENETTDSDPPKETEHLPSNVNLPVPDMENRGIGRR